jgi:hypothetical protein
MREDLTFNLVLSLNAVITAIAKPTPKTMATKIIVSCLSALFDFLRFVVPTFLPLVRNNRNMI